MTTHRELVSIVMPVFNGEKFLQQAIESVLNQVYAHWELIIVDDGSTDDTARIAQSYPDPRIRYHYQKNRGQAAALNQGLKLATGAFVTTLDADDWYPPHSLSERAALLGQHPEYGAVYGDGYYCNEAGEKLLSFSEHMPSGIDGDVFDTLIVSPFYGTGAAVLVRQQTLAQHQIEYDESIVWCQDWDFYIRLAARATFGFVDAISIYYRLHGEGMTMAMPQGRRLDSLIRTRQKVLNLPRFERVADHQKSAFFYDYLMKDLASDLAAQSQVFQSPQFRALPSAQQSRLLRIVAVRYLLEGNAAQVKIAKTWLRQAWKISPTDAKTAVVAASTAFGTAFARRVIHLWQRNQPQAEEVSPFRLAIPSDPSIK